MTGHQVSYNIQNLQIQGAVLWGKTIIASVAAASRPPQLMRRHIR